MYVQHAFFQQDFGLVWDFGMEGLKMFYESKSTSNFVLDGKSPSDSLVVFEESPALEEALPSA